MERSTAVTIDRNKWGKPTLRLIFLIGIAFSAPRVYPSEEGTIVPSQMNIDRNE